jgi:malate/lactate dehydrogenase
VQDESFDEVAFSLPSIVGPTGIAEVLMPEMSAIEQAGLHRSVEVLAKAYESMVW